MASQNGSLTHLLRSLAKTNLLVLDDCFGYSATLIASQVPVADWHLRIPDPTLADAILERIVHNTQRNNCRVNLNENLELSARCRTFDVQFFCQPSFP
jgi:DNA replication protein DnaC